MSAPASPHKAAQPALETPRRNVLLAVFTGAIGAVVAVGGAVPGVRVLLNQLRNKPAAEGQKLRVALLAAVPPDGVPRPFPVIAERVDQWSRYPREKIGEVFLIRNSADEKPICFTATCPHLGCAVDFKPNQGEFRCPCHTSAFAVDGQVLSGPSPRPLDTLEVEVRDGQVYVDYKKFRSVVDEKIPE